MASFTSDLRDLDPDVFGAIQGEISRQRETLEMIALRTLCLAQCSKRKALC